MGKLLSISGMIEKYVVNNLEILFEYSDEKCPVSVCKMSGFKRRDIKGHGRPQGRGSERRGPTGGAGAGSTGRGGQRL